MLERGVNEKPYELWALAIINMSLKMYISMLLVAPLRFYTIKQRN
jgi:hypothetical protein